MLLTIALHEFRASVMRASFVWLTLGMPVIMGIYVLTVTQIGALSASEAQQQAARRSATPQTLAVVDEGGLLGNAPEFRAFVTVDAAGRALDRGSIPSFVVIPPDYVDRVTLDVYTHTFDLWSLGQPARMATRIHDRLLRAAGVDEALIARADEGASVTRYERGEQGTFVEVDEALQVAAFAIPAGTVMGLVFALAMNASLLLASVVEDKENKMMDVLLSSARADDLLFGKVLGIVGAGLLQLTIWTLMTAPLSLLAFLAAADQPELLWSVISVPRLLLALGFGVVSFLFYGVMLVGLGSFGSSFRDSQQLAAVVILMPMVPVIASPLFLTNANGIGPRILSFFPPTAAPAMMLRVAADQIAGWEIALSFGVLLASIYVAVRAAGRLFRVGTLLYGKRPSIVVLWQALVE
ncbi:MAG: ABC transporter permease, partial [Myxococcota bacterium]